MSFTQAGPARRYSAPRRSATSSEARTDVALVLDDLVSFEPFVARGIRVYGVAAPPVERVGMVGPGHYVRITPRASWSWHMEGEPVGDDWYPSRRTVHGGD